MNIPVAIVAIILAFMGGEAAVDPPSSPPAVGEHAPDFTLTDQNGTKVRLFETRGEKVVLLFYRGYW